MHTEELHINSKSELGLTLQYVKVAKWDTTIVFIHLANWFKAQWLKMENKTLVVILNVIMTQKTSSYNLSFNSCVHGF